MGSGKRFRVTWETYPVWGFGVSLALKSEHQVSVSICLLKLYIYVGFGKSYEEF